MRARKTTAVLLALSLGVVAAACGDDEESTEGTEPAATETTAAGATDTTAAAGDGEAVCPKELVIQTDWYPELEHGGTYQLIGPNGTADKDTVSYFGPVQPQYAVGGLETIRIKTVNFDKGNSAQLLDGDADMAYIGMGDVIKDSAAIDMIVVMKTLDKDPQMLMWDPTQHDIQEPADIAATGAPVLHFPGPPAYIDYLIGKGYMTEDQSDPSYDGSDAKWVAEGGSLIQQGFASNEVWKYENEINWKDGAPADVSFFTVGEMGFDNYPAAMTMMKSRAEELDACLTLLIPKMAQAWVDFFNDPKPITDAMIQINVTHDGFWGLSEGINEAGLQVVAEKELGANSADGTYCSIDPDRAQGIYDTVKPIYDAQGVEIVDDVTTLYTNKYCEGAPGR